MHRHGQNTYHIMGMGKSGQSVAHYLHDQNIPFTISDDCQTRVKNIQQKHAWTLTSNPDEDSVIVVSPGIPVTHPLLRKAQQRKQKIVSDIDLFFQFFPHIKAVTITGSVGKTTSCHLMHHALEKQGMHSLCAGNNGTPVFSTVKCGKPFDGMYILEISSYQLELIDHLPVEAALLLNLSEHHLQRHKTMTHYRQLKQKIFRHAKLAYADTHWVTQWGHECPAVRAYDQNIHRQALSRKNHMPSFMQRPHNQVNQKAVTCLLSALGYCADIDLFQGFCGPEHRQEYVGSWHGIDYINDSKATSPSAVCSALACMPDPVFWIAGGNVQKNDIHILKKHLHVVHKAWLIGESATQYAQFLHHQNIPYQICPSLENAVQQASHYAQSFDQGTVLLSPGCSSFDQFKDFTHRGHVFKNSVHMVHSEKIG